MSGLNRVEGRTTWLLGRANARAHGLLSQAFRQEGANGYQFRVLAGLDQYGPSSQADLGRYASLDRSDVASTLSSLVAEGFVRRGPDPADRRQKLVVITAQGRAALDRLDDVLDTVQEVVLEPLTERERRTLVRLLVKLTSGD